MVKLLFYAWMITVAVLPHQVTSHFFCQNKIVQTISAKPTELTWDMLFKMILVEKYSTKYKMKINVPEFDPTLQSLNRREIFITGYVIPTGITSNNFVLSKSPYAACYFCGQGGVETVMSIKYKGKPRRYKTDDYVTLKGILELNSTNINELIYILHNAEEIKI